MGGLILYKSAFLARCEEEATSRRDDVSMEDMMPPSYSDEEEYGNGYGSEESDSDTGGGGNRKGGPGEASGRVSVDANCRYFFSCMDFLLHRWRGIRVACG